MAARSCSVPCLPPAAKRSSAGFLHPGHSLPDTWKQYFVFTITCFVIAGVCVFLALLLHTLYIWRVTDIFKEAKVTLLYPYFILSVSIMLFFLSGILCFVSAHHCWFWCVLQRPIQVEPMQTPMASHCPVTDSENKLSADSYPTLRGNRGNCLSSLHFKTSQLHALV
uniref:Uncharacterized protein n=1 Tax=Pipistrellus kuhlii TaxID=59472 RepID=A0A7J7TVZ2_PIPKU|nr:hypothetical protein mPipKuh1_009227 [Pipistrellus kuhlii]